MSEKLYDVICIGQVVQDILVTNVPENSFMRDTDTVQADSLTLTSGGDAANESVVLARLGDKAALLSRIDRRNVGNMIYEEMVQEGVDTSLLLRMEDCETFTSIVCIHPSGDHDFIVGPGRNYTLEMSDFDLDIFKKTRAVSAASLFGLGKLDTDGMDVIFRTAQEAGALTIADMNYDLEGIGPDGVKKVYPHTDYLMPSFNEAVYVTGKKDPDEIADFFLEKGVKNVVLKMGGDGCFFKNASERFYVDPFDVKPLDTTGCGDNFVAAFTHALLRGMTNRECAEFASAAGAINSQGIGAHMHIHSEQQVLDYMKTAKKRAVERK